MRQHVGRSPPRPAPERRFALQLLVRANARCVGPTSAISRHRTSTRASLAPKRRQTLSRLHDRGDRLVHVSAIRFGGPQPPGGLHRTRLFLPRAMFACRTSGIPVASSLCAHSVRTGAHTWRLPRPSSSPPRERENRTNDPKCLPSDEDHCPAVPFRAPGSGLTRPCGLATTPPAFDAFSPAPPSRMVAGWAPVRVPRCQRELRFFEPRLRSSTSAAFTTRGHTQRAFDPRTRVGLTPRYSPAPTDAGCVGPPIRCRIESLRAMTLMRRLARAAFHWRGRGRPRTETPERRWRIRRVTGVVRTILACASGTRVTSWTYLADWIAERRVALAEALTLTFLREEQRHRWGQGAFFRSGTHTRSEDRSSARARIVAPLRRRNRHCFEENTPFLPYRHASL